MQELRDRMTHHLKISKTDKRVVARSRVFLNETRRVGHPDETLSRFFSRTFWMPFSGSTLFRPGGGAETPRV